MKSQDVIKQQYHEAVETLVEKVKKDLYILAVIVGGSFSYAQVWEKSDLDVDIIGRDGIRPTLDFFALVENGVNIHASLSPRNAFKQRIESAQQGSFMHSYFSHSTLLFSRDASIREWYDKNANRHGIGERDKQLQLLNVVASTLPNLVYAEKQFYVNRDVITCFLTLLNVVQGLARIEVLLNDEIPAREVIQPALRYNPDFFTRVYTELINSEKNEAVIQETLDAVNAYLDERQFIFQPILDYLREQNAPRSNTEINAHFKAGFDEGSLELVCQWLAWKGMLRQIAVPMKLTVKSQVSVEEPAYYYDAQPVGETSRSRLTSVGETSRSRYNNADIHRRIHDAVETLTETLAQDRYVLAAILTSNLAEDNVWEKTTPHLTVILRDGTRFHHEEQQLIEESVPIRVKLHTRSAYRQLLEKTLEGSKLHAILAESEILFSKEPGLAEWLESSIGTRGPSYKTRHSGIGTRGPSYNEEPVGETSRSRCNTVGETSWSRCNTDDTARHQKSEIGERDKHTQLLNEAGGATATLAKAEKWFHLKRDFNYTFVYLTYVIRQLARIETFMHGETPKRKVIYQAIEHNPAFFNAVFTDILDKPKDEAMLAKVLAQVDAYLEDRAQTLFKPLLDFLEEAGEERTIIDIADHFGHRNLWFELPCEWLSQKGIIEQFSAPIRLTKDSQVSVEQPSYYYDADNPFL